MVKKFYRKINFLIMPTYLEAYYSPRGGGGGGGGGGTLLSYISRLGLIFGVQNFEFQYFWGFQKNEYFLGVRMKILWIFFLGHHKFGLYLGVISMHFRVKVKKGGFFFFWGGGGVLKFQIFLWGA